MNASKFYVYILDNFTLDRTSARLVRNIIDYVDRLYLTPEGSHKHLKILLGGAFGIEDMDIENFRKRDDE